MNWTFTYLALCCSFILGVGSSLSHAQLDSARYAYQAKRYNKAVYFYKKALSKFPSAQVKKELAQASYRAKQYDQAVHYYRTVKNEDRASRAANYYNLGNAYFQQQQFKKAIQQFKKALRLQPNNFKAQYNLSEALRKLNKNKPKNDQKNKEDKKNQNNKNDKEKQDKKDNTSNKNKKPEKEKKPDSRNSSNEMNKNSVERLLDQLMKAEAKTKRKINANRSAYSGKSTSGKDW